MMNGLQILPSWQEYFGNPENARLGLITIGARIGQIAALPFISPAMDRFGRRWPIFVGSSIIILGSSIQAAAQNDTMFIMGRVVLGIGNNLYAV